MLKYSFTMSREVRPRDTRDRKITLTESYFIAIHHAREGLSLPANRALIPAQYAQLQQGITVL